MCPLLWPLPGDVALWNGEGGNLGYLVVPMIWKERAAWSWGYKLSSQRLGRAGCDWSCFNAPQTPECHNRGVRTCGKGNANTRRLCPLLQRRGKLPLVFEWQNKQRMGPRAAEGAGCSAAHTRLGKGWNETAFLEGNLASCLQILKNLHPLDPHRPASGRLPQETTAIHKM